MKKVMLGLMILVVIFGVAETQVERLASFTYQDRSRGYTTSYPIEVLEKERSDVLPPTAFTLDIVINGESRTLGFDFGAGGITSAVGIDIYQRMCQVHRIMNVECPETLRDVVVTHVVKQVVLETCGNSTLKGCIELGTKSLLEGVSSLMKTKTAPTRNNEGTVLPTLTEHRSSTIVKLPDFADFESERYRTLCDQLLESALRLCGSGNEHLVEGGLWTGDVAERESFVRALSMIDFATSSTKPWYYLEVGFNAGHSAAIALATYPRVVVRSFDICSHPYTKPNFDTLIQIFGPSRLALTCGDSRRTIPDVAQIQDRLELDLADVVRVDGGHHFEVAAADLLNTRGLAKPNALVVVDDCASVEVWAAWQFAVETHVIDPLLTGLDWKGSCVGRFRA